MAITLDANLGTFFQASTSATVSLTTTNAVAAGGFIVIGILGFDTSANLTGVAGGGLTWTIDKQERPVGGSNPVALHTAVASAQAPAGLAASTVITATWDASTVQARMIGGTSFTGVATSLPVDGTPTGPTSGIASTAWATPSYPIAAGSMIYAVCWAENTDTGSTPTSPSLEAWQTQDTTNDYGSVANYRIETNAAPYTVAGTWGGATNWNTCAVAYKAADMPDSLHYSTSGGKGFTQGSLAGNGALSVAAIVKRTGDASSTYGWISQWAGSTAYVLGTIFPDAGGVNTTLATYNGSTERNAAPTMLLLYNEWYLIGLSKASGTTTPRYHLYRYSTDEWEHGNFDGTMANYPAPSGGVEWASAGGESWIGNLLVGAMWDSELADATFETLAFEKPAWITAAPDEAVRFDTTGTVTPFVGTSTQFGTTGGTLDVGDAPAGWSDEAVVEGITFVQDFTDYADSTDTVEVPVPVGGCAAGNLLIVAVQSFTDEGVLNTVEDTQGNIYTIRQQRSGSPGLNIAVADSILDTALAYPADTITVTNNDFTSGLAAVCLEYSGIDPTPFDQTTDNAQFASSITSGTVTTTQADELLFGFHMILATETWTPTDSFTVRDDQTLFGIEFISQDKIVASTGTYASTGTTVGTDNSLSIITTYKAVTEGGPTIEYHLDAHNVTPMTWR